MLRRKDQEQSNTQIQQKPLRLLPGVVIVILQWLLWLVIPIIKPEALGIGIFGGFLGGLLIIVWWAFFSRAPRIERWGAVVLMILAMVATSLFIHESLATAQLGLTFVIYGIPILCLAFVVWAVATSRLSIRLRRVTMVATILLACGVWTLLRTDGMTGDIGHEFTWRWAEIPEEQLLARGDDEPATLTLDSEAMESGSDWPGFRGPNRDGIIYGVRIDINWSASQPVELWRQPIGPGCSSFAVSGELLFTQEQRGEEEVVSCYNMTTGYPVWKHRDKARFFGADANPGPRATPTLSDGRLYTFGGTGILNVLDARDGTLIWSRNAASDIDEELPVWGFSGSPLVTDGVVVVAVAGTLVAYDVATGDQKWVGPDGGDSYSSPHKVMIDGVSQIMLMSGAGAISVAPADGKLIWKHLWPVDTRIVQVALTEDDDVLISDIKGVRCLAVAQGQGEWTIEERWTSFQLKPNFNDFVVHKGHAFGFHGQNLACIDLENGKRKWKGGRFGGQIILLADQDILLLLSEKGELVLVKATPDRFRELARFKAIEGKTWNHPVLVGDLLLVRNNQEMVAFRLSLLKS